MISTFHRGEEGFNGVTSIKTDIHFALGFVWPAASSVLRYIADALAGRIDRHFQNKPRHRLALECLFPSCPLIDPRSRFIVNKRIEKKVITNHSVTGQTPVPTLYTHNKYPNRGDLRGLCKE